jgi:hypothetical protein
MIFHYGSRPRGGVTFLFLYFILLLVVLGFELKDLCLLGRHSTTWAMASPFCFSYFSHKVLCLCWAGLDYNLLHSWDDSWAPPCPVFTGWDELLQTFCPTSLSNWDPPNLCFPSSSNYRCEPPAPSLLLLLLGEIFHVKTKNIYLKKRLPYYPSLELYTFFPYPPGHNGLCSCL